MQLNSCRYLRARPSARCIELQTAEGQCNPPKVHHKVGFPMNFHCGFFVQLCKMASSSSADSGVKRGFGGYTKHFWASSIPQKPYNKLTWVNRQYTPLDLRSTMPVQAHKFVTNPPPPSTVPSFWVPRPEVAPKQLTRTAEGEQMTPSSPATRCEEWSTLRQMLPSRGHYIKKKPEKWGSSGDLALPAITNTRPQNYPKINSVMTK